MHNILAFYVLYRKKYPEEELQDLFPESNGEFGSENFSPSWFLLQNHHNTSFNDLKAGLIFLKRRVEAQKEGQISFLKVQQFRLLKGNL